MGASDADALAAHLAAAKLHVPGFSDLDFERLSAVGRVDALAAAERLGRFAEAIWLRALAAVDRAAQTQAESERGVTQSEVGAGIRRPAGTVKDELSEAGEPLRRVPESLDAPQTARVPWPQARALAKLTHRMSDEHARAVQGRTAPGMATQG